MLTYILYLPRLEAKGESVSREMKRLWKFGGDFTNGKEDEDVEIINEREDGQCNDTGNSVEVILTAEVTHSVQILSLHYYNI